MTTEFKDVPLYINNGTLEELSKEKLIERFKKLEDLFKLKSALTSKISGNTELFYKAQEDLQNLIDNEKDKVNTFCSNFTKQLDEVHSEQQRSLALYHDAQQNSKFLLAQKDQVSVEMANLTEKIKTVWTGMIVAEEARLTSAKNLEQANLALDKYREQYSKSCDGDNIAKQNQETLVAEVKKVEQDYNKVKLEYAQANYQSRLEYVLDKRAAVDKGKAELEPLKLKLKKNIIDLSKDRQMTPEVVTKLVKDAQPSFKDSSDQLYNLI